MQKLSLVFCALVSGTALAASVPPPIADFAQHASLSQVKISPTGEYIAARVAQKSGIGLVIIRLADNKITGSFPMGENRDLADYVWANPTRLVVAPAIYWDNNEAPSLTGELIGIDAEGTHQKYLFGYQAGASAGTLLGQVAKTRGTARIIATIPDDPEHIAIEVIDWDGGSVDSNVAEIDKLNVYNGFLTDHFKAPIAGTGLLLADWTGAVRFGVSGGSNQMTPTAFYRPKPNSDWVAVNEGVLKNARILPLAFSRDNAKVYMASDEGSDRLCLVEQTLATGDRRTLNCDEQADLSRVFWSFDQKEVIAGYYPESAKPHMQYLDPNSPNSIILRRVQLSFPGEIVLPESTALDGSKSTLHVFSDRDPGGYYLFDVKSMQISPIGAVMDNIVPDQMGERRSVTFKARDGVVLHAILTIPPGVDPKSMPMVVHPHGGPFGISDGWRWDADSQLLATHGYAVLQVNYRGSGGYGKSFEYAGRQAWSTVMIDDITDGARWAEEQGFADPKRVCIYGASFGGYAALMSAVREPDLYRCLIDYAGVYDLNLQAATTDITSSQAGESFFKEFVGETPEKLRQASPRTYIDQLKAAVMIVHGEDDQRVPISQAKALRADLDHRHYPYEWLVKSGESHGFYSVENKTEFYTQLLTFLNKNIGPGAIATPPGASPSASAQTTR